MRVLLIANTLPPRDVSGVGEQVLQLAAGLREHGDEVEVLGRGPGGAAGPKVLFPLSAVPAAFGQSLWDRKNAVDSRISGLHDSIERAKAKEGVLTNDISDASSQIDALRGDLDVVRAELA